VGIFLCMGHPPVVTAEGDEVELAGVMAAFEAQWHGWILAGAVGKAVRASLECPRMR